MKLFAAVLASVLNPALSAALRGIHDYDQGRRILRDGANGIFLMADIQYENESAEDRRLRRLEGSHPDQTLNIQIKDDIYEIVNAEEGWARGLESGSSRITIPPGAVMRGAVVDVMGGRPGLARGLFNGRGLAEEDDRPRTPEQERNLAKLRRQLAVVEGTRTVLAVRVIHDGTTSTTALSNLTPSYSKLELADAIFGSIGGGTDSVTLHSQYLACSHRKLDFQPANEATLVDGARVTNIENGVVEVTVSTDCRSKCDGQMRNDVNNALGAAFGTSASSLADHVMHCQPPGAMSGIAYAYINSWNSVYNDNWCRYTSTQLHELGHNLNLAHSSEGSDNYGDQTAFMGYSYSNFNQQMCFNNAKNWQLGWFDDESIQVGLNEQYQGALKGHINYGNGNNDAKVVVKVQADGQSSSSAYYIGFNHKAKHNIDSTREGVDQVTIQEYTGTGYRQSYLQAKLGSGASWSGTLNGEPITVQVGTITTDANAGLAQVTITYGTATGPTPPPSPPPTSSPTIPAPTSFPTTHPPTPPPTTPPPTPPPTTPQPTPLDCSQYNGQNCRDVPGCTWSKGSCTRVG